MYMYKIYNKKTNKYILVEQTRIIHIYICFKMILKNDGFEIKIEISTTYRV